MSENYSRVYYRLFGEVANQIEVLERVAQIVPPGDLAVSRGIAAVVGALKAAQCETEDMFIIDA